MSNLNKKTRNIFQGTQNSPYHISIGAVVINEDNKICCHYFDKLENASVGIIEDLTLLMRETIEPNETIESCLKRGLLEEFGMRADIDRYIGSIVCSVPFSKTDIVMEKTTLYFLCKFISMKESDRAKDDVESKSELRWFTAEELINRMNSQFIRFKREDVNESKIIKTVEEIIRNNKK